MKICFISSLVADDRSSTDKVGQFKKFGDHDFYLFTNLTSFKHDTWNVIYLDNNVLNTLTHIYDEDSDNLKQCMINNVYKSRYIKFMGWHYLKNVMNKKYDIIFYCDAIYSPNERMDWQGTAKKIKECESVLIQKFHPLKSNPYSEAMLCTRCKKHSKQNEEAIINYLKSVNAKQTRIYENTTFGYDPNNEKITNAFYDFWNIHSTKKLTYRDQPLWGWMCQKHNIKAVNCPTIHTNIVHKITPPNETWFFNYTGQNFNRSRTYDHLH